MYTSIDNGKTPSIIEEHHKRLNKNVCEQSSKIIISTITNRFFSAY